MILHVVCNFCRHEISWF